MNELERRLRETAGGGLAGPPPALTVPDDLLDVAYAFEPSPVGPLLLAATRRGLVRVAYLQDPRLAGGGRSDDVLQELADRVSPRVIERPAALDEVRRELEEFFSGRRRRFDVRLDWRLRSGFSREVLRATARIPWGEVSSYKGVATAAGSPNAYRAAGNALGSNPIPVVVPCHRVLHSGGGLGGYTGGLERKLTLLEIEGFTPPAPGKFAGPSAE